jgi:hypothetical protein
MPILVAPEELCSMNPAASAMRDDQGPQAIAAAAAMAAGPSRRVMSGMQTTPAAFRLKHNQLASCIYQMHNIWS